VNKYLKEGLKIAALAVTFYFWYFGGLLATTVYALTIGYE
jgi:hypothetical protein